MHITIQQGRSLLDIARCTTRSSQFHCPFCRSALFHPTELSKVRAHLESHFNRALLHEGYNIHICGLNCRPQWHYHCINCQSALIWKQDFIKHLSLCNKKTSAITAAIPAPATTTITSTVTTSVSAPSTTTNSALSSTIMSATITPTIQTPATISLPTPTATAFPSPAATIVPCAPSGQIQRVRVTPVLHKKCPVFQVVVNKKKLKRHIDRKHTCKEKDITASSHLESQCIDPQN